MSGSESIITLQNGWTPAFAANVTLSTTIDDLRTLVLNSTGKTTITGLNTARNAVLPAPDNWIICQSWAESGVAPTWRVCCWRWADALKAWVEERAATVTVTAHASSGSSTFIGDTLYPALSHVIVTGAQFVKYSDGDATYKVNGSFSVDTTGCEMVTVSPYHASSATKANLLVSGW